ncbi:FitA-like ribbon-helix-helix domain-containing protein [Sphingomonas sp. PB4P5]|uniref:FitA-like ribbon-helix-helix domain-containing protein n=1 Tax=Parasphingomonas puruogangriensis TaxID=3096155 RepID=UPI002FC7DAAC
MATVTIRDLDEGAYERLQRDADVNQRSLEAEIRARLEGMHMPRSEVIERLRATRIDPGPDYEGSVALIRAIRDEQ